MQIIQIFPMDQQIQHVVSLAKHLQANFNPIKRCGLEKLCGFERAEQITE